VNEILIHVPFILNKVDYITNIEVNAKIKMEWICNVVDIRILRKKFELKLFHKTLSRPDIRPPATLIWVATSGWEPLL
jgi:predicted hydrolase (HD superfamily)